MDKEALHSHTGLTAADVELVYEQSREKLLALAAQQHRLNASPPTLTSHNLLVITLHWLRHKPTYQQMALLYSHSQHYWHTKLRQVIAVLDECMGDEGYRGKLGIVVPATKRAKVSKEVQQLEDEKQRGHELQSERAAVDNMKRRAREWAVAREIWDDIRESELFFNSVMRVVCALVNVTLRTHPLRPREHPSADGTSVSSTATELHSRTHRALKRSP